MENLFKDNTKIKAYAQIQKNLCDLSMNSPDDEINNFINQIPSEFLNQKEDLMMVCQLISYYSRNSFKNNKGNTIKLFEKIMKPIKTHLQNESLFFWEIFGGLIYFKRWMFEEGLISIETIIQSARDTETSLIADYFLPEIIENEPELFEKEIKNFVKTPYTKEYLNDFKELRLKHFKWLRESNDYHDPFYKEIEKDALRYSIKTDDIELFQEILSKSNLSINSTISESLIESFYLYLKEVPLIDFAIEFNAIKIFKYLIMNDATVKINPFSSIRNRNYEIIHIIENKVKEKFAEESLDCSVESWNFEMVEYSMENYDFNFLNESDIDSKYDEMILSLVNGIFFSFNFIFFDSIFLPFLRMNSRFVSQRIHEIVYESFQDKSCFFAKELLKYPGIDINFQSNNEHNANFFAKAIKDRNLNAIELLLKNPKFNVNRPCFGLYLPLQFACLAFTDMRVVEMLAKRSDSIMIAFQLCVKQGNSYAVSYFLKNFDIELNNFDVFFFYLIKNHFLFTLKMCLLYYIENNKDKDADQIIKDFNIHTFFFNDFSEEILECFKKAIHEITDVKIK